PRRTAGERFEGPRDGPGDAWRDRDAPPHAVPVRDIASCFADPFPTPAHAGARGTGSRAMTRRVFDPGNVFPLFHPTGPAPGSARSGGDGFPLRRLIPISIGVRGPALAVPRPLGSSPR